MKLEGGCLCGQVRFEVTQAPEFAAYCHCTNCRGAHSATGVAHTFVPDEAFRYTKGEDLVRPYESSPGCFRNFCSKCGTHVTLNEDWAKGSTTIPVACFDTDPGVRCSMHVFTRSKAPWYEITDALPQHETWPPGIGPDANA